MTLYFTLPIRVHLITQNNIKTFILLVIIIIIQQKHFSKLHVKIKNIIKNGFEQ